jgi:hypothetical protein
MGTYVVYVNAYFSDSFEVEANSYDEALNTASIEFSENWSAYSANGGYTMPFDNYEIDSVEEPEDEDE